MHHHFSEIELPVLSVATMAVVATTMRTGSVPATVWPVAAFLVVRQRTVILCQLY